MPVPDQILGDDEGLVIGQRDEIGVGADLDAPLVFQPGQVGRAAATSIR